MKTRYTGVEAFSGNYADADFNFVIQNLKDDQKLHDDYYATYCVMENIISRGQPSRPSFNLLNLCGNIPQNHYTLMPTSNIEWTQTIKGSDTTGYNPAKDFYDNLLSEDSRSLFMPEVYFSDIFPEYAQYNKALNEQMVDFYCQKQKLVVEIDGSQHQFEIQKIKDFNRDSELKKFGIKIRRITTKELTSISKKMFSKIENMSKEYKNDVPQSVIVYTTIYRFQILILQLLKNGKLSLNDEVWYLNIIRLDNVNKNIFKIAIDDLFLWLDSLLEMRAMNYQRPRVILDNVDKSININISVCTTWDDRHMNNANTIFVRNAYLQDRNYYRISKSDPIKYELKTSRKTNNKALCYILKNIYGFDKFREGQEKIVKNALTLKDTIGVLPTGSGKSLCYQIACLLQPCVNICIEPIKALMYDQRDNLHGISIDRVCAITSDLESNNKQELSDRFSNGEYLFIFVSPERFQSQRFRDSLANLNRAVNLPFAYAVIDEAHCMSEWGHDFRTSYLNLTTTIKKYCPTATLLGLTATASRNTLRNLQIDFGIDDRRNVVTASTYGRKELHFDVKITSSKISCLDEVLQNYFHEDKTVFFPKGLDTESMIIFTQKVGGISRKCESIVDIQNHFGKLIPDMQWYAGKSAWGHMSSDELSKHNMDVQKAFKCNKFAVLIATKAFGMGIDKPNIRYTIHCGLPGSMESLYQEAGRAGRDGKDAICTVVYNKERPDLEEKFQKVFDRNTTIAELERISKSAGKDGEDLYTQLFFMKSGLTDKDIELKMVEEILLVAKSGDKAIKLLADNFEIKKSDDSGEMEYISFSMLEKVLYHLRLIGIVEDWVIEGMRLNSTPIIVDFANYNDEAVKKHLLDTIQAYEPEFTLDDSGGDKYLKYRQLWNNNKPIIRAYSVHWEWYYDNIVYSRRIALKNLVEQCELFDPDHPDIFKRNLESYFKVDDVTDDFEDIFDDGNDIELWKKVLNQQSIKANTIYDVKMQLRRFLESSKNNVGFNFLNGVLSILSNNITQDETDAFTESISALSSDEWKAVCHFTAQAITEFANEEQKQQLARSFLCVANDETAASYVYSQFNDNYSLQMNIRSAMFKISNMWGEI